MGSQVKISDQKLKALADALQRSQQTREDEKH
jgi:hypothetical protein